MSQQEGQEALEARVLAYVREHDFVTFAALHKHFAGDAREETQILLPGNRVVWAGAPASLFDAVVALLERGALASIPGHESAYKRDGRVLDLPVEKVPPQEPHAEPHWFPVLLRPMEAVLEEQEG
ncbi:MAG: hypothetical protein CL910_16140 [Deltaproteobacteria bacterium]|jgi:hypothetical protein|nr:hypothetical protein [Deltaproteobacteria bacterium]